ncbi:hypothetical protein, variant [Capsaspora owczarzaki ATCC 30864]|nr:hypothetical protein, variant [Capsaspora owczarzaki ATCC 30864]
MRLLLAAIIMFAFNGILAVVRPSHRDILKSHFRRDFILKALMMGFLNNTIPFTLVAWAETKSAVNVGITSVLDSAIPLFGQLFGHFLLPNERITLKRGIGLVVGFAGVIVVCLERMIDSGDDDSNSDTCNACVYGYYAMIIGATASYAIASVWGKRTLHEFNPVVTATAQITSGMLINVILALLWEFNWPVDNFAGQTHFSFLDDADYKAWIGIVYLGVVSTCIAYSLYFYLLATIGSVRQTMVGFLLPIFGVFEGALFNSDWAGVSWVYKVLEVVGTLLIGAGIYFVNMSDKKKPQPDGESDDEKVALINETSSDYKSYANGGVTRFLNNQVINGAPTSPHDPRTSMHNVQSYA